MKENNVIYFRKKESVSFSNCELSKEAIDFLEGKWILDGMDAYCNAIQFFNSNKKDELPAMDYASCLRVIVYRSALMRYRHKQAAVFIYL